jgi:hypothetical protein
MTDNFDVIYSALPSSGRFIYASLLELERRRALASNHPPTIAKLAEVTGYHKKTCEKWWRFFDKLGMDFGEIK